MRWSGCGRPLVLLEAHPADDLHVTMRNSVVISFLFTYKLAVAMILAKILRRYAGSRPVWAYGSRARGGQPGNRIKRYSDLDLIVGGEPLRGLEAWGLEEAFDESRLPFRVEFQHEAELSAEFRERVEKDFVVVQGGAEGSAFGFGAWRLRGFRDRR
jgi:predicted nucleotidyltransferase